MGIELIVKREDLLHPLVSGNKWRKLKYNFYEAAVRGVTTIVSFGGAYSNHIHALAAAGNILGVKTIGMIRGEEHHPLNPTLSFARDCGMELHYVDRAAYRDRGEQHFEEEIRRQFPGAWIVPEGGSNVWGVKGCMEIVGDIRSAYDILCTAAGSGGTIAGLIAAQEGNRKVLGFSALKGAGMLDEKIKSLLPEGKDLRNNWEVNYDYHFGGYAKFNKPLLEFIKDFETRFGIKTEPVYTGKMFYGLFDLIAKGYFSKGTRIMALHTGGLQGLEGLRKKIEKILQQNSVL